LGDPAITSTIQNALNGDISERAPISLIGLQLRHSNAMRPQIRVRSVARELREIRCHTQALTLSLVLGIGQGAPPLGSRSSHTLPSPWTAGGTSRRSGGRIADRRRLGKYRVAGVFASRRFCPEG
jgi:hypothetical protein